MEAEKLQITEMNVCICESEQGPMFGEDNCDAKMKDVDVTGG